MNQYFSSTSDNKRTLESFNSDLLLNIHAIIFLCLLLPMKKNSLNRTLLFHTDNICLELPVYHHSNLKTYFQDYFFPLGISLMKGYLWKSL